MYFLVSFIINAIVFLIVYVISKKWSILSIVAGILGFVIYFSKFQQFSGGIYQYASAFDHTLTLMKIWYFFLMLFWLAIAVKTGVKLFKGNNSEQFIQSISRTLKTITLPASVDSEILTNASILELIECGLGEEVIQEKIRHSRCSFGLATSDIATLKKNKVSDLLIAAMIKAQSARGIASSSNSDKATQPFHHPAVEGKSTSISSAKPEPITPDPDPKTGRYVIS